MYEYSKCTSNVVQSVDPSPDTKLCCMWSDPQSAEPANCIRARLQIFIRLFYHHTMILSVDFEVYGRVQGVWFRKYTAQQASNLNLVGYCRNTQQKTVQGRIQGSHTSVEKMKQWLMITGSPLSTIDKCLFSNEREIPSPEYASFDILRSVSS